MQALISVGTSGRKRSDRLAPELVALWPIPVLRARRANLAEGGLYLVTRLARDPHGTWPEVHPCRRPRVVPGRYESSASTDLGTTLFDRATCLRLLVFRSVGSRIVREISALDAPDSTENDPSCTVCNAGVVATIGAAQSTKRFLEGFPGEAGRLL